MLMLFASLLSGLPLAAATSERTPAAGAVLVKPDATVSEAELIALCEEKLGNYKRPGKILLRTDPLPKTPVGKIKRKELREPFWAGHTRRVAGA
jgi:acyl-CoA synthetase (AMP-forming)/AMP-acid ligase II